MAEQQITETEKQFVIRTIQAIFPTAKIYAFGSRIRGDAQRYSDLDIAVGGEEELDLARVAQVAEIFAQSNLPYKVDLVDFASLDEDFKKIIRKTSVAWV